jgi:hypothetical protein
MTLMKPNSNKFILYGLAVLSALGSGILFPTLMFAVQTVQTDQDMGLVTSTEVFLRNLGLCVGVTIGGTVFQNEFNSQIHHRALAGLIPPDMVIPGRDAAIAYELVKNFRRRSRRYIILSSGRRFDGYG